MKHCVSQNCLLTSFGFNWHTLLEICNLEILCTYKNVLLIFKNSSHFKHLFLLHNLWPTKADTPQKRTPHKLQYQRLLFVQFQLQCLDTISHDIPNTQIKWAEEFTKISTFLFHLLKGVEKHSEFLHAHMHTSAIHTHH